MCVPSTIGAPGPPVTGAMSVCGRGRSCSQEAARAAGYTASRVHRLPGVLPIGSLNMEPLRSKASVPPPFF
jgi:hypothetical protein